jgi:hypothetical protein
MWVLHLLLWLAVSGFVVYPHHSYLLLLLAASRNIVIWQALEGLEQSDLNPSESKPD